MTTRWRLHLWASRVHKWLAIIIGIQLLLWFASGALMSFLPIDKVRGEHLVEHAIVQPISPTARLVDPALILSATRGRATALTLGMIGGRPVFTAATPHGPKLFDAATGVPLPPIDADAAKAIAQKAWRSGPAPSATVSPVVAETTEYRGSLPAWRVAFADAEATNVFVSAADGRIAAVRTATWRLYDFFWGLHIMDWWGRENFNTPWLLGFAVAGLVFWIAGAVLLRFRWPRRRRRSRTPIADPVP